jgi:hypothetical protein
MLQRYIWCCTCCNGIHLSHLPTAAAGVSLWVHVWGRSLWPTWVPTWGCGGQAKQSENDGRAVRSMGSTRWGIRKQATWASFVCSTASRAKDRRRAIFWSGSNFRALVSPYPKESIFVIIYYVHYPLRSKYDKIKWIRDMDKTLSTPIWSAFILDAWVVRAGLHQWKAIGI